MRERPPGPGPGGVNNASPRKINFFVTTRVWYKIFYIFFVAICVWYKQSIPSLYHLRTIQTTHTICIPYECHTIYLYHLLTIQNFWFLKNSFLCMAQFIRTISIPYAYHTISLYHPHTIQNFWFLKNSFLRMTQNFLKFFLASLKTY